MDFEKEYNEMVQRARELHEAGNALTKKQMEIVCPQLAESEDEAIRKNIVATIEQCPDDFLNPKNRDRMLDWLEKQKYDRMKPVYDARESFESALEKAWNDYHNGYENVDKLEDDYVECAHAKGFREGYLFGIEKQKEQKPTNGIYWHAIKKGERLPCRAYIWSQDFEKYCDCWEGRLIPNTENVKVGADTWYLPAKDVRDLPREGVDELPKEQKPVEWSEEDENIIHNICDYLLGVLRLSDTAKEKAIVFLNSLRPPKGWKEGWCEDCKVRYNHWKPSEEQMEAMEFVIKDYREDGCIATANYLQEILDQIKKL